MCGVFTDDYLIAYNFTHQKAQKSPIMHHGLIKIFFLVMKSCHKTLFTIPARSPLTLNCITDCFTLSGFNSPPAAYAFETKRRANVGLAARASPPMVAVTACPRWWFSRWIKICLSSKTPHSGLQHHRRGALTAARFQLFNAIDVATRGSRKENC